MSFGQATAAEVLGNLSLTPDDRAGGFLRGEGEWRHVYMAGVRELPPKKTPIFPGADGFKADAGIPGILTFKYRSIKGEPNEKGIRTEVRLFSCPVPTCTERKDDPWRTKDSVCKHVREAHLGSELACRGCAFVGQIAKTMNNHMAKCPASGFFQGAGRRSTRQ